MDDIYILGLYGTPTGRFPEKNFKQFVREAYLGVLQDAKLPDPEVIGGVWFSNMLMDFWGQPYVKGQVCFAPLVDDGLFPEGVPMVNVEGACASASVAFNGAVKDVLSGLCQVSLAIGVEKMDDPTRPGEILTCMERGLDQFDKQDWIAFYRETGAACGFEFDPGPGRSLMMDIYGVWANSHMVRYGTTPAHIAAAAAKNHQNSVHNPRAQYRFPLTVEQVLDDRMVARPLTRAMCAPVGDAAAAALVCSEAFLRNCPAEVQERALRISAHVLTGSSRSRISWEGERASVSAARRAYEMSGLYPADLDLVELHDACSFAEIHLVEDLGLCPRGDGGAFTASGTTAADGKIPVNLSGGLVSRGHPVGVTGLLMLNELAVQLRGEAGELQLKDPRYGLAENGGGLVGNDVAVCAVTILEPARM